MQRRLIAAFLALATVCAAQDDSPPAHVREEPVATTFDLSLVSVQATALDDLNVFFDVTVRNNTEQPIPSKLITIECVFTKHPRYHPAEKTNESGGKSGFGGVKPVPAGGQLSSSKHARLVDVAGRKRIDEGYRYLQVRVLHQAPAEDASGVRADVATLDLNALPADLPRSPPRKRNASGKPSAAAHLPGWAWQPIGAVLFAALVLLSKGIGRAFRKGLPRRSGIVAAAACGALCGAAVGFGFIWTSPFSADLGFFGPPTAAFFGLAGAVQAGMAASDSKSTSRSQDAGEKPAASLGTPDYPRRFEPHQDDYAAAMMGSRIRFQPARSVSPRVQAAIESLFGAVDVLRVLHRKVHGGLLSLCEIRQERTVSATRSGDSDRRIYTVVELQTVLLCEGRENVAFPPFNVQPRAGMAGVFNVLMRLGVGGAIDAFPFEEDPEFQRLLMVGTTVPEDVRPLLTADVRDVLKRNCEFIVTANDDCVAVSLPSKAEPRPTISLSNMISFSNSRDRVNSGLIDVDDWRTFVSRGAEVIQTLYRAERKTRRARRDADEEAEPSELHRLLKDSPPRRVPRRSAGSGMGSDWFLSFWSIGMGVMAVTVGTICSLSPDGRWVGLIILVVGSSMASVWPLFCWLKTRSRLRLLRHGRLVDATIAKVTCDSTVFINGSSQSRRYTATFEYQLDGTQRQATQSVWGGLGYRLTKLQQLKKATDVLVDPDRPERLLWVESLGKH